MTHDTMHIFLVTHILRCQDMLVTS